MDGTISPALIYQGTIVNHQNNPFSMKINANLKRFIKKSSAIDRNLP